MTHMDTDEVTSGEPEIVDISHFKIRNLYKQNVLAVDKSVDRALTAFIPEAASEEEREHTRHMLYQALSADDVSDYNISFTCGFRPFEKGVCISLSDVSLALLREAVSIAKKYPRTQDPKSPVRIMQYGSRTDAERVYKFPEDKKGDSFSGVPAVLQPTSKCETEVDDYNDFPF